MGRLSFCFIILAIQFYSTAAMGQDFKKLVKLGDKYVANGQINFGLEMYLQADSLQSGNVELSLKLGKAYLLSDFKHHSLSPLYKAYKLAPKSDPDMEFYMGMAYQFNYQFEDAIEHYKNYAKMNPRQKDYINQKIKECITGDSLIRNPRPVDIINLSDAVNSPEHDYTPLITPDESMMVFTSRRKGSTGGKKTKDNEYFEDIYVTYRAAESWSRPQNISKNINFEYHDAAAALSPDGKQLFIYLEDEGGNLYVSHLKGKEWTIPESLGENINTPYWETSMSITADGKKIFFSSDRPGGFGNLDIYVSEKQNNGTWGPAKNLGPEINTPGDEDSPFIHPDGKTLYFSSDGHPGLGRFDIFESELVDGKWGTPTNMGYPINTPDDDTHFVMSGDKSRAYYTSIKEFGIGKADIYSITFLDKTLKPLLDAVAKKQQEDRIREVIEAKESKTYTVLKGNVVDATTYFPLTAKLILTNNKTSEVVAEIESDPKTGSFEIEVKGEGSFGLSAEVKGYLFYSKNLKIQSAKEKKEINFDIRMRQVSVGSKVVLSNIFFDTDKSSIRTESISELEKIKKFLEESPNMKVQVNGHTDDVGNDKYNKILSKKRAEAVREYLVQNGIDANRLGVMGYGEERPLVSNDDEKEGRELNRRTEIEILSF